MEEGGVVAYHNSQEEIWTGRHANPSLGPQYWYQKIEKIEDLKSSFLKEHGPEVVLLGYACEEGVARNQGRIGAASAPLEIRKKLAKLPLHQKQIRIGDAGDIHCEDNNMEACQQALATTITGLIKNKAFPIVLGGGHDAAFGHYLGIADALPSNAKIGIINFDAHFDLRTVEGKGNSGTPFYQILDPKRQGKGKPSYFVLGIQPQSNIPELFATAKEKNVGYVLAESCENEPRAIEEVKSQLGAFMQEQDYLYLSIDLDGLSSAYAPGVSAPSPLGFSPAFLYKMLRFILQTEKVISCDVVELNPSLDIDQLTTGLAAKIVDYIVLEKDKQIKTEPA